MSTADLTHEEQLALPSDERGWTEEEAFEQLEQDPASLEGPNCPWHGRAWVVPSRSYGGSPKQPRVIRIGWRCSKRECGNRWGWRKWWSDPNG